MKVLKFIEISEEEFKKLENKFSNSNYYQTVTWAHLKEITNWDKTFVGVHDGVEYKAVSLILSKSIIGNRKLYYAPRGILTDYSDFEVLDYFTKEIKSYIRKNKGFVFKIDPEIPFCERDLFGNKISNKDNQKLINHLSSIGYIHKGFTKGYTDEAQYRWSFYLNTNKSDKEIIKNMNNRCRRNLKKSQKYPLVIKEVNDNTILDFKKIMESTCNRHKCFDRSLEYYKKIKSVFKNKAKLLVVYLDRDKYLKNFKDDKHYSKIKKETRSYIPLSAGLFIIDNSFVHYVYGGSYIDYIDFEAPYKLQFLMIKYAIKKGIPLYDFGGISGNFNTESPNYGVYDFKRGFGGYVVEYIGEFDLVINKAFYLLYKLMYKIYCTLKSL